MVVTPPVAGASVHGCGRDLKMNGGLGGLGGNNCQRDVHSSWYPPLCCNVLGYAGNGHTTTVCKYDESGVCDNGAVVAPSASGTAA